MMFTVYGLLLNSSVYCFLVNNNNFWIITSISDSVAVSAPAHDNSMGEHGNIYTR